MKVDIAIDDGGDKALRERKKACQALFYFPYFVACWESGKRSRDDGEGWLHVRPACLISEMGEKERERAWATGLSQRKGKERWTGPSEEKTGKEKRQREGEIGARPREKEREKEEMRLGSRPRVLLGSSSFIFFLLSCVLQSDPALAPI